MVSRYSFSSDCVESWRKVMPACLRMSVKRMAAGGADFLADCCASGAREICGTRRKARRLARRARFWEAGKFAVIGCGRRGRARFVEIAAARGWEEVVQWRRKFAARWRGLAQCG